MNRHVAGSLLSMALPLVNVTRKSVILSEKPGAYEDEYHNAVSALIPRFPRTIRFVIVKSVATAQSQCMTGKIAAALRAAQ
jgi:hypothetical protein